MPASPRSPEEPSTSGYLQTDCPPCPECGSIMVAEKAEGAAQVTLRCLNCAATRDQPLPPAAGDADDPVAR